MLILFMGLVWMIKMMTVYQFLEGWEVFKVMGNELLSWVIMIYNLKILSLLLLFYYLV